MSTADKLNKLLQTKEEIKQAIIDKGVDVGEDVVFADYPSKISAIESGGSGPDYAPVYLAKTSDGTTYKELFKNCTLTELNLNGYDTSNVTNMEGMFYQCRNLTELDVSDFSTGKVTTMKQMFYYCGNLTTISGIDKWDTSQVTNMNSIFQSCTSLTELDLSSFDTGNATDIGGMFYSCRSLSSIGGLSTWVTSKVTNMSYMFNECNNITTVGNLSNWDTSNVTTMNAMFLNCWSLPELDIRNFDMTNVTNTNLMFYGCSSLHTLRLDNCSNDTINKIITSSSFPIETIKEVTRKIFIDPGKRGNLVPPRNWKFYNCFTEEEIIIE